MYRAFLPLARDMQACHEADRDVCICGEAAGDLLARRTRRSSIVTMSLVRDAAVVQAARLCK